MNQFAIFLSGLTAGIVIGLLLRRRHVPNPRKPEDCSSCDIITCSNETGIPRITIEPRRLPNRQPGQFPPSLEHLLPEELKSHTPNK